MGGMNFAMAKTTKAQETKVNKTVAVTAPVDPFATPVEAMAVASKPAKKARVAKPVAAVALPTSVAQKRTAKAKTLDPFAEVAIAASTPVKAKRTTPTRVSAKAIVTAVVEKTPKVKKADLDVTAEIATTEPVVELSPVFKALADVTLPEITRENRARLQMQSPTRLYFYWSIRENPWALVSSVFGKDLGNYALVLKLVDVKHSREEIQPCDAEGNWWFDVEPDGEYQAEIGFYAVGRPYFRIVYSNTIATPRRSPSNRPATDSRWTVSANKFAEVLDVAGFSRDAFDVAMAGDDVYAAQDATQTAFASLVKNRRVDIGGISADELRYAMIALASGATLEELRTRVGARLFAILQANASNISAGSAKSSLGVYFEIDESEWTEEQFGSAVFGASLVNFPKTLKTRKTTTVFSPRYNPVSSHSIR